jgi:hypothetical protein
MKNKTKASLILWAAGALFLSFWSVNLAMTGQSHGNSQYLTFGLSLAAGIGAIICGAGFMQQWIIAKKK